jgi:heme ABC exporter ATP-binding subunit CcmA
MPPTTIYVSPRSLGIPDSLPPAVSTVDLARLFARSAALAGVTLRIEAGRSVALLGPNGAGKTTLLRVLATLLRPTYGRAEVDGLDVATHPEQVRPRLAYLSHATGLYPDLTARENLAFAATLYGLAGAEARERVGESLAAVAMETAADQRVSSLSAGMRRRLALGRLLLARPSLVLLDEPYSALDAAAMALVDELVVAWRDAGATVLIASHAAERVGALVDGSVTLDRGLVAEVHGRGVIAGNPPPMTAPVPAPAPAGAAR